MLPQLQIAGLRFRATTDPRPSPVQPQQQNRLQKRDTSPGFVFGEREPAGQARHSDPERRLVVSGGVDSAIPTHAKGKRTES